MLSPHRGEDEGQVEERLVHVGHGQQGAKEEVERAQARRDGPQAGLDGQVRVHRAAWWRRGWRAVTVAEDGRLELRLVLRGARTRAKR